MEDALRGMIAGLSDEIGHLRHQSSVMEIAGGERVGEADGQFLYVFPQSQPVHFRDDVPLAVRIGHTKTSGTVVSVRDGSLTVALEADLGPLLPSVRLESNDAFLLERLKARLQEVQEDRTGFNRTLADTLLAAGGTATAPRAEVPAAVLAGLNPEQRDAVRAASGSAMLFLWGPPGTGKTTTLARVLEAFWRAGLSVLLVSNINAAVDAALGRLLERPLQAQDGAILRFGPMATDAPGREAVAFDAVYGRRCRDQEQELRLAQVDLAALQDRVHRLEAAAGRLTRMRILQEEIDALRTNRGRLRQRHQEDRATLGDLQQRRADLQQRVARGGLLATIQGPVLRSRASQLEQGIQAAAATTARAAERLRSCEADIETREAEYRACRVDSLGLTTQWKIDQELAGARREQAAARKRADAARFAGQRLRETLLLNCRLLATTAFRTYLGQIPARSFDAVVIDEASTLILPLAYSVAGLAKSKVVIAGDFRQLGPITRGESPECTRWVKQSPFEAAEIPQRLRAGRPPASLVMLRSQYRMREPICEIVSRAFYGGELWTDPSVERRQIPPLPVGAGPLFWVDSSALHPWVGRPLIGSSRYNLLHVVLVQQVVRSVTGRADMPTPADLPSIGVVSPYAAQTRLLQSALAGVLPLSDTSTVHRLQGGERDVVVFDLTDSPGAALGHFFQRGNQEGDRLLNVAVSRARHHLIVVANFDFLRKQPASPHLLHLLDQLQTHGQTWPVADPVPAAAEPVSTPVVEAGLTQWFREGAAVEAVQRDLAAARASVWIAAPFTTERGVGRWLPAFDAARRRGTLVRIVTRPPESAEHIALHMRLRDAGCAMELRPGMHEKVIIVDRRILWEGSLNLLSHRDTTQMMRRSENAAYCEQVRSLFYGKGAGEAAEPVPACPVCGRAQDRTVVVDGPRRRLIRHCPSGCEPARPARVGTPCPAPGCQGRLALRRGTSGPFLGCSAYPHCRYTQPLRGHLP